MDFLKFLISKTFFKNLLLAGVIAIVLLLGTLVWLKIYTHHGQALSVPSLKGLTLEEVEDVVSSRKLRYEVIDSIYSTELPRGTVLKQSPKANSKVKVNRNIFITMNAVNLEKVAVPHLVDLSHRQAIKALENAGLRVGNISYKPDFAVNSVLQQNFNGSVIESGTMIAKGSEIDLVLGMGLSHEKTIVPNLIGMKLDSAKTIIGSKYLNFGVETYDETILTGEDSLAAFIYRQNPEYDGFTRINKGMEVFVWLSTDSSLLPVADTLLLEQIEETENEVF